MLNDKTKLLNKVHSICVRCNKCGLRQGATQVVPGVGPADAKVMITGEAPGTDEDKSRIPFCGRAGKLLTEIIEKAGNSRENIFITNVVKCHPSNNRDPEREELDICWRYLYNQILIIRPKIIITVGRISGEILSRLPDVELKNFKITKDCGTIYKSYISEHDYLCSCMPILHPPYLLRGMKHREIEETVLSLMKAFIYLNSK